MKRFVFLTLIHIGCWVMAGLGGCSPSQPSGNGGNAATQTATSTAATDPAEKQSRSPATPTPTATASVSPAPETAALRPPLTIEKLKNAEYYFLAKGPIRLTNGTYEDPETKRIYTMSDVAAYGDINKDGIKDAVTTLNITIPETGNFSYLVALVNDLGTAKNVSTEFMGPEIKVKTLKINPDNSIEAVADQYQAGDPECCPSLKITRTYKLKSNQTPAAKPAETTP